MTEVRFDSDDIEILTFLDELKEYHKGDFLTKWEERFLRAVWVKEHAALSQDVFDMIKQIHRDALQRFAQAVSFDEKHPDL